MRQPSLTAIGFVAITAVNDLASGVADELNRMAEGLKIRQPMPANAETRTHRVSLDSYDPVTTDDLMSAASNISVELKLALESCLFAEASRVDQTLAGFNGPRPGIGQGGRSGR